MVYTTELSGVARKPTISRPASGPRETGRVATGLYSECAPDADARINAARAAPPSPDHRLPIMQRTFPLFTHRQPTNPRGPPMRTMAAKRAIHAARGSETLSAIGDGAAPRQRVECRPPQLAFFRGY